MLVENGTIQRDTVARNTRVKLQVHTETTVMGMCVCEPVCLFSDLKLSSRWCLYCYSNSLSDSLSSPLFLARPRLSRRLGNVRAWSKALPKRLDLSATLPSHQTLAGSYERGSTRASHSQCVRAAPLMRVIVSV